MVGIVLVPGVEAAGGTIVFVVNPLHNIPAPVPGN